MQQVAEKKLPILENDSKDFTDGAVYDPPAIATRLDDMSINVKSASATSLRFLLLSAYLDVEEPRPSFPMALRFDRDQEDRWTKYETQLCLFKTRMTEL